jgi:elongation factor G
VTDFLPAERARGITIQSAAITLHWPPIDAEGLTDGSKDRPSSSISHEINLIDTPGHADFTFEVLRSLRVLDGAVCILDGVAGVEAQTEMVWAQAGHYHIPRLIYINKLDRDGAAFARTVREIAQKLHVWPVVCHIPWWIGPSAVFSGVGDVVNLRALRWTESGDGRKIQSHDLQNLMNIHPEFASELQRARIALVELLSEHDEDMVDQFLENEENHLAISAEAITKSLRKCILQTPQLITPVFAGASFRNIGVQPLMDAVVDFLPSPHERRDPEVTIDGETSHLMEVLKPGTVSKRITPRKQPSKAITANIQACALAFKVVNDPKRGVLVYVRVYHGSLKQGTMMFNTSLGVSERALRILRMYASDAVDIGYIESGHIGVVVGLKHTRTGDTLVTYHGTNTKEGPPAPLNTLQLKPISVPPPLFYAGVEPSSLSEEKQVSSALEILLREDPSLHVTTDPESGQTLLSGMGELHLEIACDRLIHDLKAKATIGNIEIGYREAISVKSSPFLSKVDREVGGKYLKATCLAEVEPVDLEQSQSINNDSNIMEVHLQDGNALSIHFPPPTNAESSGRQVTNGMPDHLSKEAIATGTQAGVDAALARGPKYHFPIHSTRVHIHLDPEEQLFMDSTPGAIALATRQAVEGAIQSSHTAVATTLLEPVMLATITLKEEDLGGVVHDLTSARGAQVISLDDDDATAKSINGGLDGHAGQFTWDLKKVYTPPDPFSATSSPDTVQAVDQRMRQITARVPLNEMIGYLKHLRSLTGGRGTFVMQFDRFEPVRGPRLKRAVTELRGT